MFRGLVALVMVQGHVFDMLVSPEARAGALYQFQLVFHGSTAPGFLFASGFVAGLPRAPLSVRATLRRVRRLLFVLGLGYALHLPYFSFWKTVLESTPAQRAVLFACDALQVIALSQLGLLVLQWLFGRRWLAAAFVLALAVIAAGPGVWASGLSQRVPPWAGALLDRAGGSQFPIFPFAASVLAGAVAGAALGRQEPEVRRRRALVAGAVLVAGGVVLSWLLRDVVDFWGVSPGYALLRLGGLALLLRLVEAASAGRGAVVRLLALFGHETLLVYVWHLWLLYGWVFGAAPLGTLAGRLGFGAAFLTLGAMVALLLGAAALWHRLKSRAPHFAQLALVFAGTAFVYEFLTSPW